jgi:hypothetical protein
LRGLAVVVGILLATAVVWAVGVGAIWLLIEWRVSAAAPNPSNCGTPQAAAFIGLSFLWSVVCGFGGLVALLAGLLGRGPAH